MEIEENGYIFSDDPRLIDLHAVHAFLSEESYWAKNIPFAKVENAIRHSVCFGIYKDQQQIGFARWITDKATFAYLCDVYILATFRGKGLAKKLLSFMLFHPDLQDLRRYQLSTRDAHGLYELFGFRALEHPETQLAIVIKDAYSALQ